MSPSRHESCTGWKESRRGRVELTADDLAASRPHLAVTVQATANPLICNNESAAEPFAPRSVGLPVRPARLATTADQFDRLEGLRHVDLDPARTGPRAVLRSP